MEDGRASKKFSDSKPKRAYPFENPVELATAFAKIVTVASENSSDFVARNGSQSIFAVLESILPQVTSIESIHHCITYISYPFGGIQSCHMGSRHLPVRGKVGRSELNKALQSRHGFICARSRKKALTR